MSTPTRNNCSLLCSGNLDLDLDPALALDLYVDLDLDLVQALVLSFVYAEL